MLKKAGGRIVAFVALLLSGAAIAHADSPVVTAIQNLNNEFVTVEIPEGTVSANTAISVWAREVTYQPVDPSNPGGGVEVRFTATIVDPNDRAKVIQTVDVFTAVVVTNLVRETYRSFATTDINGQRVTGVIVPGMRIKVEPVNNTPISTISIQGGATAGAASRFVLLSSGVNYNYQVMIKSGSVFDFETEAAPLAIFYGYSNNPLDLVPGFAIAAFTVVNVDEGYDGNPMATDYKIPYVRLKPGQTIAYRVPYDAFNVDSGAIGSQALFSAVGLPAGLTLNQSGVLRGVFSGRPVAFTVRLADAQTVSNVAEQGITLVSLAYNANAEFSWDNPRNYTVAVIEGAVYDTSATNLSGTVVISTDVTLGRLFYERAVPVAGAGEQIDPPEFSVLQPYGGVTATLLSTWIGTTIVSFDLPGTVTIGNVSTVVATSTVTIGGTVSRITTTVTQGLHTRLGAFSRVRYQRYGFDMLLKHGTTIDYAKHSNRIALRSRTANQSTLGQYVHFNAAVSVAVSAAGSPTITSFVPFTLFDSPADQLVKRGADPAVSEIGADADGVFTIDFANNTSDGGPEPPYYHFNNADGYLVSKAVEANRQDENYVFSPHHTKISAALGAARVSVMVYDSWWPMNCPAAAGGTARIAGYCEGADRQFFHDNYAFITVTMSYMRKSNFGKVSYARLQDLPSGDIYMGGGYCLLGITVTTTGTSTITVAENYHNSDVSVAVTGPTEMRIERLRLPDAPSQGSPLRNCYGLYQAGTLSISSAGGHAAHRQRRRDPCAQRLRHAAEPEHRRRHDHACGERRDHPHLQVVPKRQSRQPAGGDPCRHLHADLA